MGSRSWKIEPGDIVYKQCAPKGEQTEYGHGRRYNLSGSELPVSAALPPAPRVYGSRELPATPAVDVIHRPGGYVSCRLRWGTPIPAFPLAPEITLDCICLREQLPIYFLPYSQPLGACVVRGYLERNITRLNFRCSLPTRARIGDDPQSFGLGGPTKPSVPLHLLSWICVKQQCLLP